MQLRQNRRRRVLSEESATSDRSADALPGGRSLADAAPARARHAAYSPAVEREQARAVLDLLPTRYLTLTLLLLAGLTAIVSLELLHSWMPELTRLVAVEDLGAIDLAGQRSLANWFSSCLLGVTGLVALLVYSLRRHRVDDYHGRYRLWLWTVIALVLMSIDETTGLHRLGPALLSPAAAWCSLREANLWDGVWALALGILLVRLLFEMRRSKSSVFALIAGTGCLAGLVALNRGWISLEQGGYETMIASGMRMVGHLLLLFATLLYVRHVTRDAAGLLPAQRAKRARRKAAKSPRAETAVGQNHVDPPQKPQPHFAATSDLQPAQRAAADSRPAPTEAFRQATAAAKSSAPQPTARAPEDAQQANRGMTRAERKRLRRQMKLEGRSDE